MADETKVLSDEDKDMKIQSLRDMITTAEQTMQSAKAMLLQLEGKKKVGRRKKVDEDDGNVVQGTFDGQIMIGTDGKQYPIPANYASKSKLVEGDLLKLTIVDNGSFIYKQVGPTPRQNKIGVVGQDASGNYFVAVDGKPYKVLLASITYFDVQPGDEVAIITSQDENAQWASIEALLQHTPNPPAAPVVNAFQQPTAESAEPKTANAILTGSTTPTIDNITSDIIDENNDTADVTDTEITIEDDTEDVKGEITIEDDTDTEDTEDTVIEDATLDTEDTDDIVIEDDTIDTKDDNMNTDESNTAADIIDEWVPDIDEIEKEIRAEMQKTD